jgi:cyclic lactone autoinducer peptide
MILLIGTGFAYFLILIFSPVLSGKRNYSVEEIHTIRKKVRILLLAEMVIAIVLYQINFEMYKFSMYAMFTEGVLEIMGIIKFRNLNKGKALKRIMNFTIAVATLTGGTCLFILHEPPLPKLLKERLEKN